ncbi:MAG: hypothetical protein NTY07_08910 [Bacteroidia bacterium]|nr:hypothetical protein [Bacteroidia bacterium]
MKITRSNYESWFLDFLEGNLEFSLKDEFRVFLKNNPDLAKELDMADLVMLETDKTILFDSKDELKKTINDQQVVFGERAVAYYEGDLSLGERINFEVFLSENSTSAAEAEQFGKLKLVADNAIVYGNKEQLKRRVTILPLWIKIASAAAVLLLAYLLFQPHNEIQPKFSQLVDDFKNKSPKSIVVPGGKVKSDEKILEKTTPALMPKKLPANFPIKQKTKPTGQKSEKKVLPTQNLRAPEPEPSLLKPQGINFGQPDDIELAVMTLKDPALTSEDLELSKLLKVQLAAIRKSDDREILSTEHLGLSGLQLFARLSGKRLTARKGNDGVVKSVSYNSRLLAFLIPVNR